MGCGSSEAAAIRSDAAGVRSEAATLGSETAAAGSQAFGSVKPPDTSMADIKGRVVSKLLSSETAKGLSQNALTNVLNQYPEAKAAFKVPDTDSTDTDAAATAVKTASDQLLSHYTDIAKSADSNLGSTIQQKAQELSEQGVKADYIKTYGENLAQGADTKLSTEEQSALTSASNQITSKLTAAMSKLP